MAFATETDIAGGAAAATAGPCCFWHPHSIARNTNMGMSTVVRKRKLRVL